MDTEALDDVAVKNRFAKVQALAEAIDQRCLEEVLKLGFATHEVQLKSSAEANYYLEYDPGSGESSLKGDWVNAKGMKQGGLIFHADGSFYVEQDVVKAHPQKCSWFVEAINAWGRGDDIKAEARLLPIPD